MINLLHSIRESGKKNQHNKNQEELNKKVNKKPSLYGRLKRYFQTRRNTPGDKPKYDTNYDIDASNAAMLVALNADNINEYINGIKGGKKIRKTKKYKKSIRCRAIK
jgi:hypothetical protein